MTTRKKHPPLPDSAVGSVPPPGSSHSTNASNASEGFARGADGTRLYFHRQAGPQREEAAPSLTALLCDGLACDGFIWKYLWGELAERMAHDVQVVSQRFDADLFGIDGRTTAPVASIMEMGDVQLFAELIAQVLPNEAVAGEAITKNGRKPSGLAYAVGIKPMEVEPSSVGSTSE